MTVPGFKGWCAGIAVLGILLILALLVAPDILNLLCGSTTYRGIVRNALTGKPISDAKINGHFLYHGRFAPCFDGVFSVRVETAVALCKGDGRFTLTLRGFSRTLYVSAPCYESKSVRLWEINPAEDVLIGLEPLASQ